MSPATPPRPAPLLGFIPLILGLLAHAVAAAPTPVDPTLIRPLACILYDQREILEIRNQVRAGGPAKAAAEEFIKASDLWVRMTDADLERLIPPSDAAFAYGYAGDPRTNDAWPWYGGGGLCTLERPFEVRSPFTNHVYGVQKPGEKYFDDGKGWVRPQDGKKFYFKAIWNTYAITRVADALGPLSMSYLLTGDVRYANRALFILDHLATLRSHRSDRDGPIDWPDPLRPHYAMFYLPGPSANAWMYQAALALDLVGGASLAGELSPTNPGTTIFENIRKNYFEVFEPYLISDRSSLQNHAAFGYAAMITQALLFGKPQELRAGIKACYGMLDNTVGRDGEYYEVSGEYVRMSRDCAGYLFGLFAHYDPARYPHPEEFPRPEDYPYKLKFADHPACYHYMVTSMFSTTVLSRMAQYGDSAPDRFTPVPTATTVPYDPATARDYRQRMAFLKQFYHLTSRPEWKRECSLLFRGLPEELRNQAGGRPIISYGPGEWFEPLPVSGQVPPELSGRQSVIAAQKGIVVLRSGDGNDQRALFIRGGSSNTHSHNDQMAVAYYANQMCLTGSFGYKVYGTPAEEGFGKRAIAHATVVVDQDRDGEHEIDESRPPASITAYNPFGPAQVVEMSAPSLWPNSQLKEYRRQCWMVDLSPKESYFLDLFWVDGGQTHDYGYTAPFVDPPRNELFALSGVEPLPVPGQWTLAGADARYRDAPYNQKGQSWGERLDIGTQTIRPLAGEELPTRGWNPAPGNGYGFIWDVRQAFTARDWTADWPLHDRQHFLRLTMLNLDGQRVMVGNSPSMTRDRTHRSVIARRESTEGIPLRSRFAGLYQVGKDGAWPIVAVEKLDGLRESDLGLVARQENGAEDMFLAAGPGHEGVDVPAAQMRGKLAFLRKGNDGACECITLHQGTFLRAGAVELHVAAPTWSGTVKQVSNNRIWVDSRLPLESAMAGHAVFFNSAPDARYPYCCNEVFTVESVSRSEDGGSVLEFTRQTTTAARLEIEKCDSSGLVETVWPNELAAVPEQNPGSHIFEGHLIRAETDPSTETHLCKYLGKKKLTVENPANIRAGASYTVMAVQPSDRMEIPATVNLQHRADGSWEIRANMDFEVRLPGLESTWILRAAGKPDRRIGCDPNGLLPIRVADLPLGTATIVPGNTSSRTVSTQ